MPLDESVRRHLRCLSQDDWLLSNLRNLTATELGKAANHIRAFLASIKFDEVILSPIDSRPINYLDNAIDVPGVGQLRFNTEPEIWESSHDCIKYYSISTLFRREPTVNALRRSAFFIVDMYQPGHPDSMLPVFRGVLEKLANVGFTARLNKLPFSEVEYDASIDGPRGYFNDIRWVITRGYDARHSFFELDDNGTSSRREIFLVTPFGFLEVGVLGLTGWNKNPDYILRGENGTQITPDLHRSGLCFGLERLLLSEQVVSIRRPLTE